MDAFLNPRKTARALLALAVWATPALIGTQAARAQSTWSAVAPMGTPRRALGAATGPDGRIYAVGGLDVNTSPLNTAEVYSPNTNAWTAIASMFTARNGPGVAAGPDGRIYAMGGFTGSGFVNTAEAYSPSTNTWSAIAPMSTARHLPGAATGPDGRIYIIGGLSTGNTTLNTVEAYLPSTNTWTTVAPMPTARYSIAATTGPDGRIYAIGGASGAGVFVNIVEAYLPVMNTWSTVASLSTARYQPGATRGFDGKIYAIGGFNGATAVNTVERFAPPTLGDLVGLIMSFNLRQGITNSLDVKLQNAQAALNAAHAGDVITACNLLGAFINEVEAQAGAALTVDQANQLISLATQIQGSLGCP